MGYIIIGVIMFYVGWRIGRKYQDFQDMMLARRVAKLIDQRDQLDKERQEFEKWERQDKRIRKVQEVVDSD